MTTAPHLHAMNEFVRAIQEAVEDCFDAGEVEEIVAIAPSGHVSTLRAQPEMEPCTTERLKSLGVSVGLKPVRVGEEAARMYREWKKR